MQAGRHFNKRRMATERRLDIMAGNWLSELNIAWNAIRKNKGLTKGYEARLLEQLDECADSIVERGIKCVTNAGDRAGALNTP